MDISISNPPAHVKIFLDNKRTMDIVLPGFCCKDYGRYVEYKELIPLSEDRGTVWTL